MSIEWSDWASYCTACKVAFRISDEVFEKTFAPGGFDTEQECARSFHLCAKCDQGGERQEGEIITAIDLAEKFCGVIREWLNGWKLEKAILRNRSEHSPSVCHTHDFCDANMAMVEAFESFGLDSPDDEHGEASFALWNDAWDLAKRAEFDPAKVKGLDQKKS